MSVRTFLCFAAVCVVISTTSSDAQPAAAETIKVPADTTPTDVYREIQSIAHDIEQIRIYMGRPANKQAPIDVKDVAPREVIYQASTLCEKVNRLGFEMIREVTDKPVVPNRKIVPADVLRMVRIAKEQIRRIGKELPMDLSPSKPDLTEDRTPTDVFKAIVQLNRQINLLLDQRFSPSDVFSEITLAIAHAAKLRSRWPGNRISPAPKWELGKRPADVMKRLAQCFEIVRSIAEAKGLQVLQFDIDDASQKAITPSDVYDIAALLVAELAYLDRTLVNTSAPRKMRYPGRKVPSDVYQRAGILLRQLEQIKKLSSTATSAGGI